MESALAPMKRVSRHSSTESTKPTALRALSQPNSMHLPPTLPPRKSSMSWMGCTEDDDRDPRCFKHRLLNQRRKVPALYKDESYLQKMKFLKSHLTDTLFEHSPNILTPLSASPLEITPRTPHKADLDGDAVPRPKRPRPISAPVDRPTCHRQQVRNEEDQRNEVNELNDVDALNQVDAERQYTKSSRHDSMPWLQTNKMKDGGYDGDLFEDAVPFPMSDDQRSAMHFVAEGGECCPSCLLEAQAKSLNLVSFSWIFVQILVQSTSAALSRRWELRRMADQVFPVLLQLLCWFDIDTLTGTALHFLSESDSAFLHFAALLAIKYLLRVIHELVAEDQTESFHSKSMVNEVETVLPLFAEQIMSIHSDSKQMQMVIVEILILIHSKMGSQIDGDAQSEQIECVLSQLLDLRERHDEGQWLKESETWILGSVHHFLPSLIRTCTVIQQRRFIPLFVHYVNGRFGDSVKISSLQCIDRMFSAQNRENECFAVHSEDITDSVVKLICAQNEVKLQQISLDIVCGFGRMQSLTIHQKQQLRQWVTSLSAGSDDVEIESEGGSWDSWDEQSQDGIAQFDGELIQKCLQILSFEPSDDAMTTRITVE